MKLKQHFADLALFLCGLIVGTSVAIVNYPIIVIVVFHRLKALYMSMMLPATADTAAVFSTLFFAVILALLVVTFIGYMTIGLCDTISAMDKKEDRFLG